MTTLARSVSFALSPVTILAALVAALTCASCRSKRAESGSDRFVPAPTEIPYLAVKLPPSTKEYHAYESGMQHSMLQLRFEIAPSELAAFEKRLPCRLGPVSTAPPEHALVGTNDRSWYTPESAKKHRSCEYQHDIRTAAFLVDVEHPSRTVVYAVISSE